VIAEHSYPGLRVVAPICAYIFLRALVTIPYRFWARRAARRSYDLGHGQLPAPS
jgi:hypothetical protein